MSGRYLVTMVIEVYQCKDADDAIMAAEESVDTLYVSIISSEAEEQDE